MQMEELIQKALDFGFDQAAILAAETLVLRDEVRDMCAAGRCQLYGKSWMCPPACGTLEENRRKIERYARGLIVQTTAVLEDEFDYETMHGAGQLHKRRMVELGAALREAYPGLLTLGSGGCELCAKCTYPDSPCRRPDEAIASMEAVGLVVSDVCSANGLNYYYGPGTLTYTGCYLLE